MKKGFIIILALICALQLSAEEIKKIIVCGDNAYPPYEFINEKGEPEGFNVELIHLVMEELQLPYELKLSPYVEAFRQFKDKEADIITGAVKSRERENLYNFSEAVGYINYKFACRKDHLVYDPEDLKDKNIIVQKNTLPYEKLTALNYGTLIVVDDMREGLKRLSEGEGDVAISSEDLSRYLIKANKLNNLEVLDAGWLHREFCLATHDLQLLEQINAVIDKLKANGKYAQLQKKWLKMKSSSSVPLWVRFVISVLLITAILLYIFVRIYKKRARKGEELLKKENEKLRFAIQTAGMAMWEYDCQSRIFMSYNDPLADYKYGAPISMSTYDNSFEKDGTNWEQLKNATEIMKEGKDETYIIEVKLKTKYDSDWQYCTIRGVPMEIDKNGKVTKYLGIRLNITDQINYQKVLEREKEEAQEADKLKSVFLANMSHEIRTPLNAIIGFSELLQTTEDPETRKEFINIINNNNELLLRLISDILDLSKIESGLLELQPEEFDLTEVFNETIRTSRQRCTNPEIKFIGHTPYKSCKVKLDKNRVTQVGMNFITNAIKHTKRGHILIGYEYIDKGIKLYVEDTGSGIPKEKQDRLFQRFAKLDNFTQGTGLGLAICKAIVEAHGGKIGMESEEGKGSTFWAWFPCEAEIEANESTEEVEQKSIPEPETAQTEESPEDDPHKKSILIAEDIDSNYLLLKVILKGHKLTRAYNGKEVVQLASSHRYDIILMDMKMPLMNGIEATLKIREFDRSIPIVAVTANAFDSDKEKAMKAGCNRFLTKPVKRSDVEELLRELIPQ